MTLDEYAKVGSKDTFTHWIESKLDSMGSIWGGSSFKFGIYSHKDKQDKKSDSTRSYTSDYGWYTYLGNSPDEVFKKVKNDIISIILGGMPVLNFETGTKTDVVPYDILKRLYRQKSLKESRGYASYSKAKNRNLLRRVASEYLSFYSVLGIAQIEEDKYDDLENFLKMFDTKENRETITTGVENLFDELSSKAGFVMTPVYLGAGLELDTIEEEIGLYRDYIRSMGSMDLDACRDYSINKWDLIKRIG